MCLWIGPKFSCSSLFHVLFLFQWVCWSERGIPDILSGGGTQQWEPPIPLTAALYQLLRRSQQWIHCKLNTCTNTLHKALTIAFSYIHTRIIYWQFLSSFFQTNPLCMCVFDVSPWTSLWFCRRSWCRASLTATPSRRAAMIRQVTKNTWGRTHNLATNPGSSVHLIFRYLRMEKWYSQRLLASKLKLHIQ